MCILKLKYRVTGLKALRKLTVKVTEGCRTTYYVPKPWCLRDHLKVQSFYKTMHLKNLIVLHKIL